MTPTPLGWFRPPPEPDPPDPELVAYPGLTPASRVCNCAVCGVLLMAPRDWRPGKAGTPGPARWWAGRPRCRRCHPEGVEGQWRGWPVEYEPVPAFLRGLMTEGGRRVVRRAAWGEESPWGSVALRAGEDGGEGEG